MKLKSLIDSLNKVRDFLGDDTNVRVAIKTSDETGKVITINDEEHALVNAKCVSTDGETVTISN